MSSTIQRVPIEELKSRAEWQVLTARQQLFVETYIQSGLTTGTYDAVLAVRCAYDVAVENAEIFSYELLANKKIDRILALHFGWSEQHKLNLHRQKAVRKLLRVVRFQLRHAEPGSTGAQRLTSQLQSLLLDEPEAVSDEPKKLAAPARDPRIPAGASALVDAKGVVKGYRTAEGENVQLAEVEVS